MNPIFIFMWLFSVVVLLGIIWMDKLKGPNKRKMKIRILTWEFESHISCGNSQQIRWHTRIITRVATDHAFYINRQFPFYAVNLTMFEEIEICRRWKMKVKLRLGFGCNLVPQSQFHSPRHGYLLGSFDSCLVDKKTNFAWFNCK